MSAKYNFDEVIDRRGTASSRWDARPEDVLNLDYPVGEVLPLWVADMDFRAPDEVIEAVEAVVKRGVFGYGIVTDSCLDAVADWEEQRHGWRPKKEWMLLAPGAVPALHMLVRALTGGSGAKKGVVIQRPVYYPFTSAIEGNGAVVVNNPLKLTGQRYEMDFDDLKGKLKDAALFVLCSPHNPVGRVWSRSDLETLGEMCAAANTPVFADELHCDLVSPEHKHLPFALLGESFLMNSVTVIAPSKTFNLAGLQATVVIIPNDSLRRRFANVLYAQNALMKPNIIGVAAMEAAFRWGGEWFDEAWKYIRANYDFLVKYLADKLPEVKVFPLEGTYLAWLDFRALESDPDRLRRRMLTEAKVWLDDGFIFGSEGAGFERIVLATPRATLEEALCRITASFGVPC
ncbi:MAG: pyridoxal phosphate-dependent aminotransferase [Synergistaceae bacterium]|jgi:cystathionine beta-lyase|nr:pyridoxal phosphate-dependent aminotransferase [Synergistaceae bacterium]